MSTGAAHYAEAERLLTIADQPGRFDLTLAQASELARRAQAHATLALAAATATRTVMHAVEREEESIANGLDPISRVEVSAWDETLGGVIDDD